MQRAQPRLQGGIQCAGRLFFCHKSQSEGTDAPPPSARSHKSIEGTGAAELPIIDSVSSKKDLATEQMMHTHMQSRER